MTIDLTGIILGILSLLFAYITKVIVPLIRQKIEEMKQNGEDSKVNAIKAAVAIGTYSAEQLYDRMHWEEKLNHAMQVAQDELDKRGISIDIGRLRNYVEASVRELRIEQGQATKEPQEGQTV